MSQNSIGILFAVIPAYNEAKSLPSLISELTAFQKKHPEFRWVIVNDGSTDQTQNVLCELNQCHLTLPFNMGIGVAVQTGFQYAISHGAAYVAQVDGDGQHIPEQLEVLLNELKRTQADLMIGSRFTAGQARAGLKASSLPRWLGGRFLCSVLFGMTGFYVSDPTSGFRMYSRRAAQVIANDYPDDYPEVEAILLLSQFGMKILETRVVMRPRLAGESSITKFRSIYYVIKVTLALFVLKLQTRNKRGEYASS